MSDTAPRQNGKREYRKHGLVILKRAVNSIGNRLIDRRTVTGKALAKWRADLIRDLGGDISTQQSALVDLAVKSKLLLDSIDVWLLSQRTLISYRKRAVIPVVRERQQLADGLAKYLTMLGLQRVSKALTLSDLLNQDTGDDQDEAEKSTVHGAQAEG